MLYGYAEVEYLQHQTEVKSAAKNNINQHPTTNGRPPHQQLYFSFAATF